RLVQGGVGVVADRLRRDRRAAEEPAGPYGTVRLSGAVTSPPGCAIAMILALPLLTAVTTPALLKAATAFRPVRSPSAMLRSPPTMTTASRTGAGPIEVTKSPAGFSVT